MKYIIAILKFIGFISILFGGWALFVFLMDIKSFWAIPSLLIWIILLVIYSIIINLKKCPKCNKKSLPTGISGSKYKQYYCSKCRNTFWTTL